MTKDERIAELEDWNKWYEMWHTKFKKQIEELTTELETYRPTKLTGEGQTTCHCCKERSWTCFGFYHYKGQTLCDECLKKMLKDENKNSQLRHEICEKIRRKMTVYRYVEVKTKNGYEWALTDSNINEILDQIEQGEE